MKSLPLKYRPQQLEDLVGQEFIKTTLKNALTAKIIAPAYLFAGPRGTGKTSTARIMAKSLNCLNVDQPTIEPCGECSSCRSIERSNAIDVTEIDAASHNGVDNAIGNDSERRNQELEKLLLYAGDSKLGKSQVAQLVAINTQTSLQLASAIKAGQALLVAQLTQELLAKGEPPLKLIATLITQFRTWLWTKLALAEGIKTNAEIAQIANVGNVNRVYYLRQEVAKCSVRNLSRAVVLLYELQIAYPQGMKVDSLQSRLLITCQAFQVI